MSSESGKSDDRLHKAMEIILSKRAETDPANQPLIAQYMEAISDPHGVKAQELLAKLAELPDGKFIVEDITNLRMQFGFDPFGRRHDPEEPKG